MTHDYFGQFSAQQLAQQEAQRAYQKTYQESLQRAMQSASALQSNQVQVIKVNGKNGADSYYLPPNSSVLLLDTNEPIIWFKFTDGAGYATVTPYRFEPMQEDNKQEADRLSALEDRIKTLEGALYGQSDSGSAKRATDGGANGASQAIV